MSSALPADDSARLSRTRVVFGVSAAWIVIAVIVGVQATIGSALMASGDEAPMRLGPALRTAAIQTLPWLPVTLAAIALARRFPMSRNRWPHHLPVHFGAALALAFVANVLVVLGFWTLNGRFGGFEALMRSGARWAVIRLHLGLMIYAAIIAITHTVISLRRARARELHLARVESQLTRAQLQALNAQIRPHFLFNTLHTIGQLWRSGRSEDADAVLDSLGVLFHKVQASSSRTLVPLADELEMVRQYLAIEERRYQDRLRVRIDAPDDVLELPVPPLVLQPIVENAIRHGVATVSSAGCVSVRAKRDNGSLQLVVQDDGPGPSPRKDAGSRGSGVGISNTRERLAQLYGRRASLSLRQGEAGGTIATVVIPLESP